MLFLFLGLVLRVAFSAIQGLSHDELSAWNRLGGSSFSEVLSKGVLPDMHPAFMQVLLQYWTGIFGDSEFSLRFPGLIFALMSIILVYRIGIKYFNNNVGLFASSLLLFPAFPIIHSSLARPYAPGIFFVTLFLCGIFKLEDSRVKKEYFKASLILVIAATGSIYTHYYAGLMAGLIGLSALFYVKISRWRFLILSGFIALLLFLPHWEITKVHLSRDGLGWLGSPEWYWFWDFLKLYFGDNYLFAGVFFLLLPVGLRYAKFKADNKSRFLLLTFALLYVVSHAISFLYTPILREPGVFMIMPLLLLGLGSFFKWIKPKVFNSMLILFSLAVLVNTIFTAKLFENVHFEPFREITELVKKYDDEIGKHKILKLCNVTNINYLNYYARYNGADLDFEMTIIEEIEEIHELAEKINTSTKDYVMLARTNRAQNVIQLELIQNSYPKNIVAEYFFNANFNLWGKGNFGDRQFMKSFDSDTKANWFLNWSSDSTKNEFIGDLRIPVNELCFENSYILFRTSGWCSEETDALNFVVVAERNGEIIQEGEVPLLYQAWDQIALDTKRGERLFFTAVEIPAKIKDGDQVHVYFWNRTFAHVKIEKPQIYVVPYPL